MKCNICKEKIQDDFKVEDFKYGIICNNCDCELLSIKNNTELSITEKEFVDRFKTDNELIEEKI